HLHLHGSTWRIGCTRCDDEVALFIRLGLLNQLAYRSYRIHDSCAGGIGLKSGERLKSAATVCMTSQR
ncbi:hypothetical protein, partial [Pseudomonas oryzihabitans]|uniref:hypothetical protein n=1 Tax=Pseudomonas oryzihabitans TaxID=47885 RepID=UPI002894BB2A